MFSSNKFIFIFAITVLLLISNVSTETTSVPANNDNADGETRASRIIGGIADDFDEVKYSVALHDGYQNFCGGSIINERFVLTAAHCVIGHDNVPIQYPLYTLIGGTNKLLADFRDRVPKVSKIFVLASFNGSRGPVQNADIAVLKLDRPIQILEHQRISKVNLPNQLPNGSWDNYEGKLGTITGTGATSIEMRPDADGKIVDSGKRKFPGTPRIARAVVMPQQECEDIFSGFMRVHKEHMCARMVGDGYRGICTNDAGNALAWNKTIIGVASFGNELCDERVGHAPAVYTRVAPFMYFIEMVMANMTSNMFRVYDMFN